MIDERDYMSRALELAEKAIGRTFPNPLVGAVIVSEGRIVGEGYHAKAGAPHAEIEALKVAGDAARGATLYLNLEPCCHYGQTPPCTEPIIDSGIARVVFSTLDPDRRVMGRGAARLREKGIAVEAGLMAKEAIELNLQYLHSRISHRPFIVLKLALTLDGKITAGGDKWLTSDRSRVEVHRMRSSLECVAVGRGTIEADDPFLDRRLFDSGLRPPVRMVFDSALSFPAEHHWLRSGDRVILYCTARARKENISAIGKAGGEVVVLPEQEGRVDLGAWVDDVSSKGFSSVLIEGGGRVADSVVRLGILDRLVLFHAPLLSGAGGAAWFRGEGRPEWFVRGELSLGRTVRMEEDVLAVYDRKQISGYADILTWKGA